MSLNIVRTTAMLAWMLVALFALGPSAGAATGVSASDSTTTIPKLVDLGAGSCIPCKKMAPILESLGKDYAGRFDVVFIDVWKDPDGATPYRIRVIPTQIFFDAKGKELYRHEGFYSRDQILEKWRSLGFAFASADSPK